MTNSLENPAVEKVAEAAPRQRVAVKRAIVKQSGHYTSEDVIDAFLDWLEATAKAIRAAGYSAHLLTDEERSKYSVLLMRYVPPRQMAAIGSIHALIDLWLTGDGEWGIVLNAVKSVADATSFAGNAWLIIDR